MQRFTSAFTYTCIIAILLGLAVIVQSVSDAHTTLTLVSNPLAVLPPHEHDTAHGDTLESKGHMRNVRSDVYVAPTDLWVTGVDLVTQGAPQNIIHHMNLLNADERNPWCPALQKIIVGMGQDSVLGGTFPRPYALFIKKGTHIIIDGMLHNPEPPLGAGDTYHDVSVGFTLHIDPLGRYKHLIPLDFQIIFIADEPSCVGATFTVPPHTPAYTRSSAQNSGAAYTFTRAATIPIIAAHLHPWEGGKEIQVFVNSTQVADFTPQKMSSLPDTWQTSPQIKTIKVRAGDTVSLKTLYANPYAIPETGAMASAIFFVAYDTPTK